MQTSRFVANGSGVAFGRAPKPIVDVRIRQTEPAAGRHLAARRSFEAKQAHRAIEMKIERPRQLEQRVENKAGKRSVMYYRSNNVKLQRHYSKYYSEDGTIEVKYTIATGEVVFISYLGGDAYSAPMLIT